MKNVLTAAAAIRKSVERKGILLLRLSIAVVYLWFGALKFVDGNAAEVLATQTISWLTVGIITGKTALWLLGIAECLIGLALLLKYQMKIAVLLMYAQMLGTALPLFIFREKTWISFGMPTLEGQYIIKNIVLISAAIILGAAAHGGKLIVHPEVARKAKEKEEAVIEDESQP